MAVFVELDDDVDAPQDGHQHWAGNANAIHARHAANSTAEESADPPVVTEDPNLNSMTEALGCYPIVMALAAGIDLNTLDSLSRTCRAVRAALLQYRKMLLVSTLHCYNEHLPIDPDDTLRFRARAGNWFYMEEQGRTNYNGKSGQCARDLVKGCRRCGTVVCRNCAIKPPAPIVHRDRHRRLCVACTKEPLGRLTRPTLPVDTLTTSEYMQEAVCQCGLDGVWLCQPCGRSIRSDDTDYRGIWKWRNLYGEVLGGLGTGIGEGDRGVICGRGSECAAARDCEQETDCDAEDAREAESILLGTPPTSQANLAPLWSGSVSPGSWSSAHSLSSLSVGVHTPAAKSSSLAADSNRRTPSPAFGPGYARHEIEGIGGVVKTKLVKMVKVGACVPEWEEEKARGEILGREVKGKARSWCGWCWRVVPGHKDFDADKKAQNRMRDSTGSSSD